MLPEPLHPAVVHFPIVLAVLLPFAMAAALRATRRGAWPRIAWALPFVMAVALTASTWFAIETGEAEEERVEAVVPESALHAHEEAAERLLLLAAIVTVLGGVGFARATVGAAARGLAATGSVIVLLAAVQVGSAGGDLVYRWGAAQAYASPGSLAGPDRDDGSERDSDRDGDGDVDRDSDRERERGRR